jgi:hypothetical protein
MPSKHKRVNLTLDDQLYSSVKALADASGMSTAGLITHLIRGASPVFPAMVDVLLKGALYDTVKAHQLENLIAQTMQAPASTEGAGADAQAHAGAGIDAESSPRLCNTGAKKGKTTPIYH